MNMFCYNTGTKTKRCSTDELGLMLDRDEKASWCK
jgi:hypothetical protein